MAEDLNPDFDRRTSRRIDIGRLQKGLEGCCRNCGCIFETDGNECVTGTSNEVGAQNESKHQGWWINCPRCSQSSWVPCPNQRYLDWDESGEEYFYSIGRSGRQSCFVATACFSDSEALEVRALRVWRDTTLKGSRIGRCTVRIYYGGMGQVGAKLLNTFPFLKPRVRQLLNKLIKHIRS